jgi:hypothetical protein
MRGRIGQVFAMAGLEVVACDVDPGLTRRHLDRLRRFRGAGPSAPSPSVLGVVLTITISRATTESMITLRRRCRVIRAMRGAAGASVSTCWGTLVVQVEADDGTVGFGVTTAGEPGAWIVERHLARFPEGAPVVDVEKIWDQMFQSTLFYGRKGLVLNVISAVDLALYDLSVSSSHCRKVRTGRKFDFQLPVAGSKTPQWSEI